jgi:hypothetical protein
MSAPKNLISGALYDFAAWLTAQPEPLIVGLQHPSGPIAGAVGEFLKARGIDGPDLAPRVQDWMEGDAEAEEERTADRLRLVRELDVALNGEAGAAKQASLVDLVAQVQRQTCVQILRLSDGMRINFRAPDGRRATLFPEALLTQRHQFAQPSVPDVIRAAIEAYPVAGDPLPVAAELDAAPAGSQIHPESALPSAAWPPLGEEPEQGLDSMGRLP